MPGDAVSLCERNETKDTAHRKQMLRSNSQTKPSDDCMETLTGGRGVSWYSKVPDKTRCIRRYKHTLLRPLYGHRSQTHLGQCIIPRYSVVLWKKTLAQWINDVKDINGIKDINVLNDINDLKGYILYRVIYRHIGTCQGIY